MVDRGLHGPAPFSGVVGVPPQLVEVDVLLQGGDQEIQQPGADHRSFAPGVEDLHDILDQVDLLEELEALRVGLHDRVLDAVVNHLREVPSARLAPRVDEAGITLGAQRIEGRLGLRYIGVAAATHQGVAVLETPDATGDAAIDEADALFGQGRRVLLIIGVLGVAAVHDGVALFEVIRQGRDGLGGRSPGRDHHPHDARSRQRRAQLGQVGDVGELRVAVVAHDGQALLAHPGAHVATHLPESDEADLHGRSLRVRGVLDSEPVSSGVDAASTGSGIRCRRRRSRRR